MFFASDIVLADLLGIFKLTRNKSRHQSDACRGYDSLSIRISGSSLFFANGKSFCVKEGELVYFPQNCSYTQETEGETIIAIHFMNYSYADKKAIESITVENRKEITELILHMYTVWNLKKPGCKYECTSLFYHLLYLLRMQVDRNRIESVHPEKQITAAIDYMHKHYKTERIYITDLAKMAAVSETYFRRLFKRIYGVSPNRYIINLKLEYAAQLLQSKLYSVSEVSEKSGFSDVKYFERLFKEKYRFTPRCYKNLDLEKHFF